MKRLRRVFLLCLAACWVAGMLTSPASAHGVSIGVSSGGLGRLIIVVLSAAILFTLFIVFNHPKKGWTVLVTGGGGYVGSALVPKLLKHWHRVTVLDLYPYGDDVLSSVQDYENLTQIKGDFRHPQTLVKALKGCDAVIHLAGISDGSSPDPGLAKSVNYEAFQPLVRAAKKAGVKRFIYASSFCVYGVRDEPEVTEELPPEPLTDFSKHKVLCEKILEEERAPGFVTCTVRPAMVCGYAPSQRLDLIVNTLTDAAVNKGRIRVFGGSQKCPNIHIDDLTDVYLLLLNQPDARIDGKTFNAVSENLTVLDLAVIVKNVVDDELTIDVEPTDDPGSYQMSPGRLFRELGFEPSHTVKDAVSDLVAAFRNGKIPNSAGRPESFDTNTHRA